MQLNNKSICYNSGKEGHIAPQCPEPKCQQANQASTGSRREDHKGKCRNYRNSQGQGQEKGEPGQHAKTAQQPESIVNREFKLPVFDGSTSPVCTHLRQQTV
jgi:hypothetical protein